MVMASAGVNMAGNDGNPSAAGATPGGAAECRRLSPPPSAAAASGSTSTDTAGPSAVRRRSGAPPPPPSPPTSSSSEGTAYTVEEEDTETEEDDEYERRRALPPMAPVGGVALALPAPSGLPAWMVHAPPPPAPVWPLAFGALGIAGRMRENEDTFSLRPGFYTWVDGAAMHFFAVFDGHGGTHVSALCRNQMHQILAEELDAEAGRFLQRRRQHFHHASFNSAAWDESGESERSWRAALLRAFARVDALATVACACGVATVPRCACPLSGITSAIVGSTAVVAVIVGGRIVVANCGDSRAVLCQGELIDDTPPVPLSQDHKPDRPDERARIESVGGQVINNNGWRVRGILAMSRALGDRFLRPEVISVPEITITQRTDEDQCLILASDGMWDVISNDTACAVARRCLHDAAVAPVNAAGGPIRERRCDVTAALLANLAMGRESQDNISIVILDLKNRAG